MAERLRVLNTRRGPLALPAFLPDATRAAVRSVDAKDIAGSGIACLMVNIIHLANRPGISAIKKVGGIHRFMDWPGPIFSDSGGFQVFSLIQESSSLGSVGERGFSYRLAKDDKKRTLTPEQSIQKQFRLGADVMFCLDYCTHPQADDNQQRESVRLTIAWAKRCKQEFERLLKTLENPGSRPLLFAVIQGGSSSDLRKRCSDSLLEIGFDGYGFGGWPIDAQGNLVEAVHLAAEMMPAHLPLHGLGIGKPEHVVTSARMGYNIFDCVLPTRDARHRRLYVFNDKLSALNLEGSDFYGHLYIQDNRFVRDAKPVEEGCDCACCRSYSRAYLHHLFKSDDPLFYRLATIHNLRFYSRLMEKLQQRLL